MDLKNLLSLAGRKITDKGLIEAMKREDIDISLIDLAENEFQAYLEIKDRGIALIFSDESWFLGLEDKAIGTGVLFFTGVFVYLQEQDGYSKYLGSLPHRLSFSYNSDDFINQFGNPSWSRSRPNGSLVSQRWDNVDIYRIHITYGKESGLVSIIYLGIPEKSAA